LRQRPEDIPQLAKFFLKKATEGATAKRFTPNALCDLSSRYWMGNVLELRNCVERAAIMTRGDTIDKKDLPESTQASTMTVESAKQLCKTTVAWAQEQLHPLDSASSEASIYEDFLTTAEPSLLKAVLDHCQNNRAAAARLLGLHRATLRQKLRTYGLNPGEDS
jgi:two-component system nitrogen regulation response regulator GlnG